MLRPLISANVRSTERRSAFWKLSDTGLPAYSRRSTRLGADCAAGSSAAAPAPSGRACAPPTAGSSDRTASATPSPPSTTRIRSPGPMPAAVIARSLLLFPSASSRPRRPRRQEPRGVHLPCKPGATRRTHPMRLRRGHPGGNCRARGAACGPRSGNHGYRAGQATVTVRRAAGPAPCASRDPGRRPLARPPAPP